VEVVLSHVCSEWRDAVINLPTLWTAFKFDTRFYVSDPANKLEEYLSRSGEQLLELYFRFSGEDYQDEYRQCTMNEYFPHHFALVETVIAHAYRWHRFTLFSDRFRAALKFIDLFEELYVPNLEYLAVCLGNPDSRPDADTEDRGNSNPTILTGGAPRLYTVRIDTTSHFHSMPPLSNITTLAIQSTPKSDYLGFEFHHFHSILTIPTLTNLSIESFGCIEYHWREDPGNVPRFNMPSLKTLRIIQDGQILGILSFMDAPLLETLVLRDVDLGTVIIHQDVQELNTFIRLDTIALLDCRYQFSDLNQEDVDRVDMILNTFAYHATHVIISSHGDPPFIERGSSLMDFNRYGWPRLQLITLDLSATFGVMPYITSFERSPHSITVRVVQSLFRQWARQPGDLMTLEKVCRLETMKVGDLMMDEPWPASGGLFQEDGNLPGGFIWEETLRAGAPRPWGPPYFFIENQIE